MKIKRFEENPIIQPNMDDRMGSNINGPSLIKAPDWLPNKLGTYYLYFADHGGTYIRLAYADSLHGPWTIHSSGSLQMEDTNFKKHIASPDVHIDENEKRIRMYYHGFSGNKIQKKSYPQWTQVALSKDGIQFQSSDEVLGSPYWRVFNWNEYYYAVGMPAGCLYRSKDPLTNFEKGPELLAGRVRHNALKLVGDTLHVFYTCLEDCPEHIVYSTVQLNDDWTTWNASDPVSVLKPEESYEGADEPLVPSKMGRVLGPAHQLRDPCLFEEDGRHYLLYSVAGEYGIAIAEITDWDI